MGYQMPEWAKAVKKELIERNMSVTNLAEAAGLNRVYVSAVLSGRIISESAKNKILAALGLENEA